MSCVVAVKVVAHGQRPEPSPVRRSGTCRPALRASIGRWWGGGCVRLGLGLLCLIGNEVPVAVEVDQV